MTYVYQLRRAARELIEAIDEYYDQRKEHPLLCDEKVTSAMQELRVLVKRVH